MKNQIVIVTVMTLIMTGCAVKGATPAATTITPAKNSTHKKYLAKNVVFKKSSNSQGRTVNKAEVDATAQVSIDDIVLGEDETIGRLQSKTLKDALSNEIAANLSTLIQGKKWIMDSKTTVKKYAKNPNNYRYFSDDSFVGATVEFNTDGTLTVEKCMPVLGQDYACGGNSHNVYCLGFVSPPEYELFGNNTMMITFSYQHDGYTAGSQQNTDPSQCSDAPSDSLRGGVSTFSKVLQVVETSADRIVLMNAIDGEVTVLTPAE